MEKNFCYLRKDCWNYIIDFLDINSMLQLELTTKNFKTQIDSLSSLLHTTPDNFENTVQSIVSILDDLCSLLKEKNYHRLVSVTKRVLQSVTSMNEMKNQLSQFGNICEEFNVETANDLTNYIQEIRKREETISQLLKARNTKDIIPKLN